MEAHSEKPSTTRLTREDESILNKTRETRSHADRVKSYRQSIEEGGVGRLNIRNPKPGFIYHYEAFSVKNENIPNVDMNLRRKEWEPVSEEECLEIGADQVVGGLVLSKRHEDFAEIDRENAIKELNRQKAALPADINNRLPVHTTARVTDNSESSEFMVRKPRK